MYNKTLGRQLKRLRDLKRKGLISKQQLSSIRGQILNMKDQEEIEGYLEKIIERAKTKRAKGGRS